ncbi:GNAT family N-acetyltransferase [Amycolatopsis sp. RTGN1]|uniref:GNAT family N-acetyltransferase n=1 Tax=Amycolatopsis ponsaeliensis TaxID=2992142 RepID=UPI00254C2CAB|nr:GNAT family N-acetyltransferase [Amycolatopsis sp. RTGN1]
MTVTQSAVTLLQAADLPKCQELALDRDWPREDVKWRLLFAIGEPYGIRVGDSLAACAVLTKFGDIAAVSMVLVASRFGRRGLGRQVLTHLLDEAGDGTVFLHATPAGRPLYESLGFAATGGVVTCRGTASGTPSPATRAATPDDHAAIRALDRRAWGVARTSLLDRLFLGQVRVFECDGAVAGYAVASDHGVGTVIGPVVAEDEAMACALAVDTARAAGGPVRVDAGVHAKALRAAVEDAGIAPVRTVPLMARGPLPGDAAMRFAPAMQAVG